MTTPSRLPSSHLQATLYPVVSHRSLDGPVCITILVSARHCKALNYCISQRLPRDTTVMVRTLPWLVTSNSTSNSSSSANQSLQDRPKTPKTHDRLFNSSPPLMFSPTKDEMLKKDEAWIMVEDELLSTAQTFTRSLHIKEDRRRRSLARRRTADTLNIINRPTDPRAKMSSELRMKKSYEIQGTRTQEGLNSLEHRSTKRRKVTADSDSDSDVPIGDRNLAGLMQGSRQQRTERKPLDGFVGPVQTNTRATRGHDSQMSSRSKPAPATEGTKIKTKKPVQKLTSIRPYQSPPSTPDHHSPDPYKARRRPSPARSLAHLKIEKAMEFPELGIKHRTEKRDKGLTPDDSDLEDRPKPRLIRRTLGKKKVSTAASTPIPAKLDLDEIPFFDV